MRCNLVQLEAIGRGVGASYRAARSVGKRPLLYVNKAQPAKAPPATSAGVTQAP
ncbi:hypothetical protein ACFSLT_26480 [Novosphingobium resinovorum]